jgi:serine/threonine protein phosphatase 1
MQDLIFAIGDIHGRLDLTTAALEAIEQRASGAESFRVIFLGDYVDRGPDSRGVVELMMRLSRDHRYVCLKGNHEAMMVQCLTGGATDDFTRWMDNGGRETLQSYDADDWDAAIAAVPTEHVRWMKSLPLTSGDGHRIYVHAGLMPSTPFDRQTEETCLWIRERFLRAAPHQFDGHVVHGHTPQWAGKPDPAEPEFLPHRTNLDLAAYSTDRLCVGVFDAARPGGPVELIMIEQVAGESARRIPYQPPAALGGSVGEPAVKPRRRLWRR